VPLEIDISSPANLGAGGFLNQPFGCLSCGRTISYILLFVAFLILDYEHLSQFSLKVPLKIDISSPTNLGAGAFDLYYWSFEGG